MASEPSSKSNSALLTRLASALVLAPLVLAMVHVGGMAFEVLLTIAAVILVSECSQMVGRHKGWVIAGGLYVAAAIAALWWLRTGGESGDEAGRITVYWLFAVVWGSDLGGYFVGRTIGGPKLAPAISPNKTWSGFFGGVVLAVVFSWGVASFYGTPHITLVVLAVGISVVSQLGDLLESAVKRHFGVKDSGAIIPGHGGLFDRVDGLVAAAIALVGAMTLINGAGGGNVLKWMV